MKLKTNFLLQGLLTAAHIINLTGGALPPGKPQAIAGGALAVIQSILAVIAHFHNTDGTPQEVAGPKN